MTERLLPGVRKRARCVRCRDAAMPMSSVQCVWVGVLRRRRPKLVAAFALSVLVLRRASHLPCLLNGIPFINASFPFLVERRPYTPSNQPLRYITRTGRRHRIPFKSSIHLHAPSIYIPYSHRPALERCRPHRLPTRWGPWESEFRVGRWLEFRESMIPACHSARIHGMLCLRRLTRARLSSMRRLSTQP